MLKADCQRKPGKIQNRNVNGSAKSAKLIHIKTTQKILFKRDHLITMVSFSFEDSILFFMLFNLPDKNLIFLTAVISCELKLIMSSSARMF